MTSEQPPPTQSETPGAVTVHYWASARAAAGLDEEQVPVAGPMSLAELRALLASRHPESRLGAVLEVCAVLVGDRPAGADDPASVILAPGDVVEFLPPFAGG